MTLVTKILNTKSSDNSLLFIAILGKNFSL